MKYFFCLLLIISFSITTQPNNSQTNESKTQAVTNKPVEKEIGDLRLRLKQAIDKKDKDELLRIYVDDFTHTHAVGKVDNRASRVASLLKGEPTIESSTPTELQIRSYGDNTAIAIGLSKIPSKGKMTDYRWITVYVKQSGNWQIAASQASIYSGS